MSKNWGSCADICTWSAEVACWRCVPLTFALLCGQRRQGDLTGQVGMLEELDKGFSRTGVQSFALEGILGELQVLTFRPPCYNSPCLGSCCTTAETPVGSSWCPLPLLHEVNGNVNLRPEVLEQSQSLLL